MGEGVILFLGYAAVTKITMYKIPLINSLLFLNTVNSKWKQRQDRKLNFSAVVFVWPGSASYLLYALSFLALSKALSMVFSFSPLHLGQYHFPFGL